MNPTRLSLALALLLAAANPGSPAAAQALADPTRPPNVAAGADGQPGERPANRLQSVILSSTRKLAVINGETVPLGGKYRETTLVRISETEVVLKSGDVTETLKLYPGVEKIPARGKAPPAGRSAR